MNEEKRIVGSGYNGMPTGCSDDILPWGKNSANFLENKYAYVCHAEMNAILNNNSGKIKGSTIYTVLFPCNECAKLIIQVSPSCGFLNKLEIFLRSPIFKLFERKCFFFRRLFS